MAVRYIILLVGLCGAPVWCVSRHEVRAFPEGFMFGAATASYQIEGAWNADGKSESIWDRLTHSRPEHIKDGSNGDIADNSYYLYKRDVQMMRELGLDFYRFSISWPRILPTSFPDKINQAGVDYYNNLIDEMLKYNIKPMMTLFHWDLPQKLQDLGGWANPEIVTWFADYARVVFTLFGDRVKDFITINEPFQICSGYEVDGLAPAIAHKGVGSYMCAKNLLVAHAKAYHIYDQEFRPSQRGNIFISLSAQWYEPASDSDADVEAAHEANQFNWATYSWPIFSETGDFPPEMRTRIAAKSAEQGFPRSRLPEFSPEEIEMIRGSSDFFGLNHYSTNLIHRNESVPVQDVPSYADDLGVGSYTLPEWQIGESQQTKYVPWGFTNLLNRIKSDYRNPPVIITENGIATHGGLVDDDRYVPWGFTKLLNRIKSDYRNPPVIITENGIATHGGLVDDDRVQYYRGYLDALLDALEVHYVPWGFTKLLNRIKNDYRNPPVIITENGIATHGGLVDDDRVQYYRGYLDAMLDALDDGCDIRGYTAWSLLDNFEWTAGYTERFGLYEVDYDNIYRTRTPRKSAYVYKELLRTRTLDHHYEPDLSQPITIDAGH